MAVAEAGAIGCLLKEIEVTVESGIEGYVMFVHTVLWKWYPLVRP